MKKIIAAVVLAFATLGGTVATALPASATVSQPTLSMPPSHLAGIPFVKHIVWTKRWHGYAFGHAKVSGKYTTVTLTLNHAVVTIYLNKPYREVEYFTWDSTESVYLYAGGKCLPRGSPRRSGIGCVTR